MPFEIQTVTAFVMSGDNGDEGILGVQLPDTGEWVPLIGANSERIQSLYPQAMELSKIAGRPFKVLQFSARVDITEETKVKYGTPQGDAGYIGEELLQGISELEEKCRAAQISIKNQTFSLDEALEAYGISHEQYNSFIKNAK